MKRIILLSVASILLLILLSPVAAFADDSNDNKDNDDDILALNPKFIVDENNWKLIIFSDNVPDKIAAGEQIEAYGAKLLNDMIVRQGILIGSGEGLRSGNNQMTKAVDTPFGNSYFRSFFSTYTYWTSSPASFWGSAGGIWFGTSPSYYCDEMLLQVNLDLETWLAYFVSLPNGWNNGIFSASSPFIYNEDCYSILLPWSGVTATYVYSSIIEQKDYNIYYFEGYGDTWVVPDEDMRYGE
jgi:hypothetical protein